MEARILRPADAATYLGVSRMTIYRLVSRGELPKPLRMARNAVGWDIHDLDDFIERLKCSTQEAR
jgi:prophage regulatory protein